MLFAALSGCYVAHEVPMQADASAADASLTCTGTPPVCVRTSEDACNPPRAAAPSCGSDGQWHCPLFYDVAVDRGAHDDVCLPFHDPASPIVSMGGAFARVPIGGRCVWVVEDVQFDTGVSMRNVAFDVDTSQGAPACPRVPAFWTNRAENIVMIEGGNDPSLIVQVTGGFLAGGESQILYRLFRLDANGGFGVVELGTGIGRWDASLERIVVPGPDGLRWQPNRDFGDAYFVDSDYAYVWGCPPPIEDLIEACVLTRLDSRGREEIFTSMGWSSPSASSLASMFSAGPWVSSVFRRDPSRLMHVFAYGFGNTLETYSAPAPQGPWTRSARLAPCDLPSNDPDAYCAGPVVHEELADVLHPNRAWVSYNVGTTAVDWQERREADPAAYWPRLVSVALP